MSSISINAGVSELASTKITDISYTSARGQITGLSNVFNTDYYNKAGVATTQCSSGQSSQPSGTKGTTTAHEPDALDNTSTNDFSVSGLSEGTTYTLYGWVQAANDKYYPAGSKTFTTNEHSTPSPNPVSNLSYNAESRQITFTWNNGSSYSRIHYVFDGVYGSISGSPTSKTFYNLHPNTSYSFQVWGETSGGNSSTRSITGWTEQIQRPPFWNGFDYMAEKAPMVWYAYKVPSPCTAELWNQFQNHVNDVHDYIEERRLTMTDVSKGQSVTAAYNNIRDVIASLSPPVEPPPRVSRNDKFLGHFKALQDSINSIA